MTKALMLVSQSNTGSTWFSSAIRISCPNLRTSKTMKEWFNPVLNWEHRNLLSQCLGSEIHGTVDNLARTPDEYLLEQVVASTWDKQALDFTKENYLAYQLDSPVFTKRFNMIGLLGEVEDCFPPQRIRVMIWYDCWYHSLMLNKRLCPALEEWVKEHANSTEKRALVAWQTVRWRTEEALAAMDAPIIAYNILMNEDERSLKHYFEGLRLPEPLEPRLLARTVFETRRAGEKSPWHGRQWAEAFEFLPRFQARARVEKFR